MNNKVRQYSTYKNELFCEKQSKNIDAFCSEFGLEGMEVFMDDVVSRDKVLFNNYEEKENIIKKLLGLNVKRIHCSYWAYPTSFLTKNKFNELIYRFGNSDNVVKYYGDLTGMHMFQRWMQEYEIACEINAQSYTFHLIDYAPIDGKWEFTISKEEIRQAMVFMIQQFINNLMDKKLLTEDSPQIELENAGWGLEYGIQTAEDYNILFSQIYDPYKKVKIGWDINHLLHSIGYDEEKQLACFFLTDVEISREMKNIQLKYGSKPDLFAQKWLEYNILHPNLVNCIGSLHLSDCVMKNEEYFRNGKLAEKYYKELSILESWEQQENYGVDIVLSKYDSHIPLGGGILVPLNIKNMIYKIQDLNSDIVILHELKNSINQTDAIKKQIDNLDLD